MITRLVYRLRNLITLVFIFFARFMTQELYRKQCIHGRPQKLFQGVERRNFAYPFQIADDQCKWTFTKRFTLSASLVICAG